MSSRIGCENRTGHSQLEDGCWSGQASPRGFWWKVPPMKQYCWDIPWCCSGGFGIASHSPFLAPMLLAMNAALHCRTGTLFTSQDKS